MRIAILVNDVDKLISPETSVSLARYPHARGHDVWMFGLDDLTYFADGHVGGDMRAPPDTKFSKNVTFLESLQGRKAERQRVTSADLDVLWLRYNPGEGGRARDWETYAGILFGQIAMRRGVLVLNHPDTLSYAITKMYFQHLPEAVRPRCVITRSVEEVRAFYRAEGKRIVLKPLDGYGGRDVFLLKKDATNLTQIVESIVEGGYVVAQEYMPDALAGDTRMIMVNGKPLERDGHYAAFRRVNPDADDFRSNISAGGKTEKARITDKHLELAELVGPKLKQDGIFFAGLDIVGDKLVEINTISTGGINAASSLEGVEFTPVVIDALERKVSYRENYGAELGNRILAVME